jgi:hypothetical protein
MIIFHQVGARAFFIPRIWLFGASTEIPSEFDARWAGAFAPSSSSSSTPDALNTRLDPE